MRACMHHGCVHKEIYIVCELVCELVVPRCERKADHSADHSYPNSYGTQTVPALAACVEEEQGSRQNAYGPSTSLDKCKT